MQAYRRCGQGLVAVVLASVLLLGCANHVPYHNKATSERPIRLWIYDIHDRSGGGFHETIVELELTDLRDRVRDWFTGDEIVFESEGIGGRVHVSTRSNPYRLARSSGRADIGLEVKIDGFQFGNLVFRGTQVAQDLLGIMDRQRRAGLVAECTVLSLPQGKEIGRFQIDAVSRKLNYPRPAINDLLEIASREVAQKLLDGEKQG